MMNDLVYVLNKILNSLEEYSWKVASSADDLNRNPDIYSWWVYIDSSINVN